MIWCLSMVHKRLSSLDAVPAILGKSYEASGFSKALSLILHKKLFMRERVLDRVV